MADHIWIIALAVGLTLAVPARNAQALSQLTNSTDPACMISLPFVTAEGIVAFESTCDLTGENADGNREVFRRDEQGMLTQVTQTTACTNSTPSLSADGAVLAFETDCDLGANADRNVEIVAVVPAGFLQVTTSAQCFNLAPSVTDDGSAIAFDSDCDLVAGSNADRSVEIFLFPLDGTLRQVTNDVSQSGCQSQRASASFHGSVIAFESDCDLVGTNEDQVNEIFTAAGGVVAQLTQAAEDTCLSTGATIDDAGSSIAFESSCDFSGTNPDGSTEVFVVSGSGIQQVSFDGGDAGCASTNARVSDDGLAVSFNSWCDPLQLNADGSYEVFFARGANLVQVTTGLLCSSVLPASAAADAPLVWVSDCNPLGTNADKGSELFSSQGCACGAPRTRGTVPTASDALIVLQTSVALRTCADCECDVNSDALISASDALAILRKAVGQDITLTCD